MTDERGSPAGSSSTTCSSSSSPSSAASLSHRKRSPPKSPIQAIMTSTPRQLSYSPIVMEQSPIRSLSSPIKKRLFRTSKGRQYVFPILMMVGLSICGSFSLLFGDVDQHSMDVPKLALRSTSVLSSSPDFLTKPRLVYLDGMYFDVSHRILQDDPTLHAPPGEEAVLQDHMAVNHDNNECIPMADWQSRSFPNCNKLHEMDLVHAMDDNHHERYRETSASLLGTGWFRSTWKYNSKGDKSIVLKTLRLDREFYDEFYDLHRRDAVAMERLTHSAFVMNIYGFCGQSALNELADFNWDSLEKFNRHMRGRSSPTLNFLRLQMASSVAAGLAHVHEIDDQPSMVHYDVNPRNVAIVEGGRPKLNDFNTAEFLRYNPKTNKTCGFPSRFHEPWWRAPEEVTLRNNNLLDEKVDVYALGNIIYHIVTTHAPRGKMKRERMDEVRKIVAQGIRPHLDAEYTESEDPSVQILVEALDLCYHPDPAKRPSARHVARMLMNRLTELKPSIDTKLTL